jgi:hypothetical protein
MQLFRSSGVLEEVDNPSDISRYPDVEEGIRKGRLKLLTVYFLKGDNLTVWVGGGDDPCRKVESQTGGSLAKWVNLQTSRILGRSDTVRDLGLQTGKFQDRG